MIAEEFTSTSGNLFEAGRQPCEQRNPDATVTVDPAQHFQPIDGFGASFTDASAYLMNQILPAADRNRAMRALFDAEEGIGLSVVRNPMGASDYARFIYSYDDLEEGDTDPGLTDFSIDHDRQDVLPLTRWAGELNPELQVFATPWSAPGWMKDSGSMVTGTLLPQFYDAFARYFVRYIQECAAEGVPIAAVSPQNEPLFVPDNYPGMYFPADAESRFIRDYLKPAFQAAGLETKIMAYDHNWDNSDYGLEVLSQAGEATDGVAWHWYAGEPSAQSVVHDAHPDKEVHFFEGSGGFWIPDYQQGFLDVVGYIVDSINNHSRSYVMWNMALDENNGPVVPGFGESVCRGLLTVQSDGSGFEPSYDYYALAHFSKWVRPGAIRIGCSVQGEELKAASFLNRDGSLAVVLLNQSDQPRSLRLLVEGRGRVCVALPGKSVKSVRLD